MRVNFLLGPAGSGKTHRCLEEIRLALAEPEGPPLLLLAPKQATFQLERQILAEGSIQGYTRLQILSFERLAEMVIENLDGSPPRLLEEEGRLMVLRAILMERQKELRIFHATARLPGFARQLSLVLRECQRSRLTPAQLRNLASKFGSSGALALKLSDLAILLEAYFDWLEARGLQDISQLLDVAAQKLRSVDPSDSASPGEEVSLPGLRLGGIWLDGFAEMTEQELDLLGAILPYADHATLAFCLEKEPKEDPSWLSTWAVVAQTFRRCWNRLSHEEGIDLSTTLLSRDQGVGRFGLGSPLAHLERHWAESQPKPFVFPAHGEDSDVDQKVVFGQLRLVECSNPETEAIFAAREVLRKVREEGLRFRDVAVLVRSLEEYHIPLRRVFTRYGIPFFMDRREPVAHHPLAEFTRSVLRIAAMKWRHEDLFSALKSGLTPLDEAEVDWLENAALAHGWEGEVWYGGLRDSEGGSEGQQAASLASRFVPGVREFCSRLELGTAVEPTGVELALAIRELWLRFDVGTKLADWAQRSEVRLPQSSSVHLTVWEEMQAWLENLELAFTDYRMPLREWLPILEAGLGSLTVGVIPPSLDQVLIGSVDRSRNPELKLAVILGANESRFPAPPPPPRILTESERRLLELEASPLGPNQRRQMGHERYYGYIAFTRSADSVAVTWSSQDSEGRPLNPSPFISHLRRLFPEVLPVRFEAPVRWSEAEHVAEVAVPLLRTLDLQQGLLAAQDRGITPLLPAEAFSRLRSLPALAALEGRHRSARAGVSSGALSAEAAARLYGKVLLTSVSALEDYAACPFQFFVARGLGAKERDLFETDIRERGSFQHELLKVFHETIADRNLRWRDLTAPEARLLLHDLGESLMTSYRGGLFRSTPSAAFLGHQLIEGVIRMMGVLIAWMTQYQLDPIAVEVGFGFDPEGLPAWELHVDETRRLRLRGRIDRIDVWKSKTSDSGLVLVLDYKSSAKKLDPIRLTHGLQLQLLSYLGVLQSLPNPERFFGVKRIDPLGGVYVPLKQTSSMLKSRLDLASGTELDIKADYVHRGRWIWEHVDLLDSRHGSAGDQFHFKKKKDQGLYASCTDPMSGEAFHDLITEVESKIVQFGREIYAGAVGVAPYQLKSERACDRCDFQAVCRFDPWVTPFRVLKELPEKSEEAPA